MAKISILTGPEGKRRPVEAIPFLPGLYIHRPPSNSGEGLYNITHRESGLAILTFVSEPEIEVVRMVLGKVFWEVPAASVYAKPEYYECVKEALRVTLYHAKSKKQEEHIAEDLDGKRQPASGSRWGYRRDVITPEFLVEAKTTERNKFSVSIKDLDFLKVQAYTQGKVPVFIIEMQGSEEVALLPTQEFSEEELAELDVVADLDKRKNFKSFTVSAKDVAKVTRGGRIALLTSVGSYSVVSYETFLTFAKRDI